MTNKALILISVTLLTIILSGCASSDKIAARKAAKEEAARTAENILIDKMREKYPCDTSTSTTTVKTITRFLPGTPIYRRDTVQITDTLLTEHTNYTQHTVVDSAAIKKLQNSLLSAQYRYDSAQAENGKLKAENAKTIATITHDSIVYKDKSDKWDKLVNILLIAAGVLSLGGLILLFLKFKSKIGL